MQQLLKNCKVYIEYDTIQPKHDRYGRTLAFMYRSRDGLFLNEELVKEGYADVYEEDPCKYTNQWLSLSAD